MLGGLLSQKFGTLFFPRDIQLLLFLIADVVSSTDIAAHIWLFRPSYEASCRYNQSELWLCTFSCSHILRKKASTSWTDSSSFTVIAIIVMVDFIGKIIPFIFFSWDYFTSLIC